MMNPSIRRNQRTRCARTGILREAIRVGRQGIFVVVILILPSFLERPCEERHDFGCLYAILTLAVCLILGQRGSSRRTRSVLRNPALTRPVSLL